MITISITTIIAGAVVVLLAILGSLVNPFLRSLRFPETEGNETEGNEESGNEAELSQKENAEPVTILITAHDNLVVGCILLIEKHRQISLQLRQVVMSCNENCNWFSIFFLR